MANTAYESVDHYLASQPENVRPTLQRVRRAIQKAVPAADEVISYQIPAYKLGGRPVVFFAGWKAHFSLYPMTAPLRAAFKAELVPYKMSKGTIRFPLDEPVPVRLIARLAKFRAQEVASLGPKKRR